MNAEISVMILPQVHLRKPCYDFYDFSTAACGFNTFKTLPQPSFTSTFDSLIHHKSSLAVRPMSFCDEVQRFSPAGLVQEDVDIDCRASLVLPPILGYVADSQFRMVLPFVAFTPTSNQVRGGTDQPGSSLPSCYTYSCGPYRLARLITGSLYRRCSDQIEVHLFYSATKTLPHPLQPRRLTSNFATGS